MSLTITQDGICTGIPQPSRSAEIIRDIVIIAAITFPIILLRFISRNLVSSKLGWDDWVIGIAAVGNELFILQTKIDLKQCLMIPMTVIPILSIFFCLRCGCKTDL